MAGAGLQAEERGRREGCRCGQHCCCLCVASALFPTSSLTSQPCSIAAFNLHSPSAQSTLCHLGFPSSPSPLPPPLTPSYAPCFQKLSRGPGSSRVGGCVLWGAPALPVPPVTLRLFLVKPPRPTLLDFRHRHSLCRASHPKDGCHTSAGIPQPPSGSLGRELVVMTHVHLCGAAAQPCGPSSPLWTCSRSHTPVLSTNVGSGGACNQRSLPAEGQRVTPSCHPGSGICRLLFCSHLSDSSEHGATWPALRCLWWGFFDLKTKTKPTYVFESLYTLLSAKPAGSNPH